MILLAAGIQIKDVFGPATTFPTFGDLVNVLTKNVFVLAGVLVFVFLIVAGLKYIMSAGAGDEKEISQSKTAMTAALIGFLLIFTAYWLIQIIEYITGIAIFKPGI